jgi:hypothetical protein
MTSSDQATMKGGSRTFALPVSGRYHFKSHKGWDANPHRVIIGKGSHLDIDMTKMERGKIPRRTTNSNDREFKHNRTTEATEDRSGTVQPVRLPTLGAEVRQEHQLTISPALDR